MKPSMNRAADMFLNYFITAVLSLSRNRLDSFIKILGLAIGLAAVLISWATVTSHALRVAHANPIKALRYE